MLKSRVALLIAGGLLGAQVSFAVAESPFPPSTEDILYRMTPAQEQYFKARETANPNPAGASGSVFPPSSEEVLFYRFPPSLAKYLDEKSARLNADPANDGTVRKVTAATKYIDVQHEATVTIVNEQGQSFVWTADTWGEAELALRAIAPRDFIAGKTKVYVRHPYDHIVSD